MPDEYQELREASSEIEQTTPSIENQQTEESIPTETTPTPINTQATQTDATPNQQIETNQNTADTIVLEEINQEFFTANSVVEKLFKEGQDICSTINTVLENIADTSVSLDNHLINLDDEMNASIMAVATRLGHLAEDDVDITNLSNELNTIGLLKKEIYASFSSIDEKICDLQTEALINKKKLSSFFSATQETAINELNAIKKFLEKARQFAASLRDNLSKEIHNKITQCKEKLAVLEKATNQAELTHIAQEKRDADKQKMLDQAAATAETTNNQVNFFIRLFIYIKNILQTLFKHIVNIVQTIMPLKENPPDSITKEEEITQSGEYPAHKKIN